MDNDYVPECDFCHESKNKVCGITRCCGQWTCVLCNPDTKEGCGRCLPINTVEQQKNLSELFQKCASKTQTFLDKLNTLINLFDKWILLYSQDKLRIKTKECLVSDREKYENRLKRCNQFTEFGQHPDLFHNLLVQCILTVNEWINESEPNLSVYEDMVIFKPVECIILKVDSIDPEDYKKTTYTHYAGIDHQEGNNFVMSEWKPFQCNYSQINVSDAYYNIMVDSITGTRYQFFRHKSVNKTEIYSYLSREKKIFQVEGTEGRWGGGQDL
jgi:hypothetical protein